MPPSKVYLVTRQDLTPGQQAVQAAHALQELNQHARDTIDSWYATSNTLALLATPDEGALERLYQKALDRGIPACRFQEPDLNNQTTAIALGPEAAKLVRSLPLALKEVRPP